MDGLLRLVSEERKTNPAVHRYFHYAQGRTQTQVRGMYVCLPVYCLKCEAVCAEVNKVFVMVPSVLLDQFQDDHSFKKKKCPVEVRMSGRH